jgi:hypothetical protein
MKQPMLITDCKKVYTATHSRQLQQIQNIDGNNGFDNNMDREGTHCLVMPGSASSASNHSKES